MLRGISRNTGFSAHADYVRIMAHPAFILRRCVRIAVATVVVYAVGLGSAALPLVGPGAAFVSTADAKQKSKGMKRLRTRSTFPGVVPPNPGLRMPDPNRPAYNSGTVAPLAIPRQDPVVPGGGYVPQVAPAVRGPETYQDRVSRCTHQSGLGGLSGGQSGVYIHNCSM
jgi:hypothetical protein